MHIGIIGVGRLGRAVAYTLVHEEYIEELSLVDIVPGVAEAIANELMHVAASLNRDIELHAYSNASEISGAKLLIITAGMARKASMSRRDLAIINAKVMKELAEILPRNNKGARYLIITNPVDAMATLFRVVSKEKYVISSGTYLDSLRFRTELALKLKASLREVEAYVGGEHGPKAVFLWSMTRVRGLSIDDYERRSGVHIPREDIEKAVKEISKFIISKVGATVFGPAAAFRDIVRSIALNLGRVMCIAAPIKFKGIPMEINVSVPRKVGLDLEYTLFDRLSEEERSKIAEAANEIYKTYLTAANVAGII